jgi:hypothetical protein
MAQRDNILQELKELQSLLVNASALNIYQVPAGYFEGLAEQVMRKIRALEAKSASEELSYLYPLLGGEKKIAYSVPAGYFEGLAEQVLRRVKALEAGNAAEELDHLSPLLGSISKEMPYAVPSGYFRDLAEEVTGSMMANNQTAAEELETLSPLLSGLKKEMPYSVPQGYFEELGKATGGEPATSQAKVISFTRQRWFRYAVAAVVTGIIVLAGFLVFDRPGGKIDPNDQSFAWVKKNLKKVSTDDLDEFAELATDGTLAVNETKNDAKESSVIQELIKDIPDEELQQFLEETQTAVDEENNDDLFMN